MTTDKEFPLLESILLIDGKFPLLDYHQARMNYAAESYFGQKIKLPLQDWIASFPFTKNPSGGRVGTPLFAFRILSILIEA